MQKAEEMQNQKIVTKRSPRATVEAIMAAAGYEFGQHGLEGASMDNIARRCGRTKQLLYHYYGSKERLFAEVVSKNHKDAILELVAHDYDSMDPQSAFRMFLRNIAGQYRRFPEWASLMLDENLHGGVHYGERRKIRAATRPLMEQFQKILDRGALEGVFARQVDTESFFAAAFSLVTACYLTGRVMSEYLSIDLKTDEGMDRWENYAAGLLLAAISPGRDAPADEQSPALGSVQ